MRASSPPPRLDSTQTAPAPDPGSADRPARPLPPTPLPGTPNSVPGSAPHFPRLTEHELHERLGWFISIRWLAGAAALLLVLLGRFVFHIYIPLLPVAAVVAAMFAYNTVFLLLVRSANRRDRVDGRFARACANAQILCDLLALAVLMHLTGGIENPFLIFAICPLVIASELLPARVAYAYAAVGALLVQEVAWAEYFGWLPHVPVGAGLGAPLYQSAVAVAAAAGSLSLLAFATVFLGASIAGRLRRREAELEAAYEQLKELERSKSFLMRQTSHDLRSPLNALVSIVRVVSAEAAARLDPPLRDLLNRAEERALGLSHLVDELHRFAVLRESPTLRRDPLDLADTVTQAVRFYSPLATEKGLRLTSTAHPAATLGDPEALGEALGNLLSNAIQYTPASGSIHVELGADAAGVRIAVQDTGIGIPPDALPRIFDEFYRAPNAKTAFRAGTGMGLPIVKRIIEAHGGRIDVTSTPGHGTRFTIFLP